MVTRFPTSHRFMTAVAVLAAWAGGCQSPPPGREAAHPIAARPIAEIPVAGDAKSERTSDSDVGKTPADSQAATEVQAGADTPAQRAEPKIAVPETARDAAALWESHGRSGLPQLAIFFGRVELSAGELEPAFRLVRSIALEVKPGDRDAAAAVQCIVAFLRLGDDAELGLSELAAPVSDVGIIQLAVGLRPASELTPVLVAAMRSQSSGSQAMGPNFRRCAALALAFLGDPTARPVLEGLLDEFVEHYEAGRTHVLDAATAVEIVCRFGDPALGRFLVDILELSDDPRVRNPCGRCLATLWRGKAEAPLVRLLRRNDAGSQLAAIAGLLRIGEVTALNRIIHAMDRSEHVRVHDTVKTYLRRYAAALDMTLYDLEAWIRSQPAKALVAIRPYMLRLEVLSAKDRRLSRDELVKVLEHWRQHGTIHTPEWKWVRDRHVLDVAELEDVEQLEMVRQAVLRQLTETALAEARTLQRIQTALRRRAGAQLNE